MTVSFNSSHSSEILPSPTSSSELNMAWIENLALEEIGIDDTGIIHLGTLNTPEYTLEESSILLMQQLRDLFETHILHFNRYRGDDAIGAHIKIFKISQTINDFMLFRHSLRLLVTRKSHSCIQLAFLGPHHASEHCVELQAHLGPFNTIVWSYQGEAFSLQALTKFFLTEFIIQSIK